MQFKQYIKNILIGLDQLGNTIIGGKPDETMSSRCYRNAQKYWYAKLGQIISKFYIFVLEINVFLTAHLKN